MASLQTKTSIANAALLELGSTKQLTDVALESGDQQSRDIATVWDALRDFHLKRHSWNFAIKRATLNRTPTDDGDEWAYSYSLPPLYLRWLPWRRGHRSWFDGEVEGGKILTNAEAVRIRYIARIESVSEWSPEFVKIMTYAVAEAIAEGVTQSAEIKRDMGDKLMAAMPTARRIDGLETGQRRRGNVVVRSDILSARNRSGTSIVRR